MVESANRLLWCRKRVGACEGHTDSRDETDISDAFSLEAIFDGAGQLYMLPKFRSASPGKYSEEVYLLGGAAAASAVVSLPDTRVVTCYSTNPKVASNPETLDCRSVSIDIFTPTGGA